MNISQIKTWLMEHKKARIALILSCVLLLLFVLAHPRGVKTYLVIGMDNYGSLAENGRNDVTMLVQVDFGRSRISAVTMARDMFIENENGRLTKINTLVKSSGEQGLTDAIERNFGVRPDGWFRINFTTLIELVDAIGGVDVELSEAEARYVNREAGEYPDHPLAQGMCHLNGAQALTYARCRKLDSDMGRGERQNKLVAAMVARTKKVSIPEIINVFRTLGHAWRSSLSGAQQAGLLASALWLRGAKVERIAMPFEGEWRYGNTESGASGVIVDLEANRALLLDALGR